MKKNLKRTVVILAIIYLIVCGLLYWFQESFLFFPQQLSKSYRFTYDQPFEEVNIKTSDGVILNSLLFKADSSKGLIFYLHGNAGSLASWGKVAKTYTDLNYDVFIPDYRGYGKSEGSISSQEQLFGDMQTAYDEMKKLYSENKIIVLGYSIGTGPAARLASTNHPELLILQAPYYNLKDMMRRKFSFIPTFILKYTFDTNEYLKSCTMPVIIFHGDADEVIYFGSSLKLQQEFKPSDKLITLKGQGHNGMTYTIPYKSELEKILQSHP